MSARYNSPTWAATAGPRSPSLGKARVTVAVALMAGSETTPVVVSTPDGASNARTGTALPVGPPDQVGGGASGSALEAITDHPVDDQFRAFGGVQAAGLRDIHLHPAQNLQLVRRDRGELMARPCGEHRN